MTGIFLEILERLGKMPLPPYIKEELEDGERYQTVYSRVSGSAAAPTAGLHFTQALLEKIERLRASESAPMSHCMSAWERSAPVKVGGRLPEHQMHAEFCMLSAESAGDFEPDAQVWRSRIICVGTTSCRTLESLVEPERRPCRKNPPGRIFSSTPATSLSAMQGLITNFHLPESTLIMLVSAFAGYDHVMAAYREAVAQRYRFFSFGDAMLIL